MRVSIVAVLLCVSAILSPAVAQDPPAPAAMPVSVTLPPDLDRVLRDYERAWRSGDASKVAALFAADGFVLQNGRAPIRGRAAIDSAYSGQASGGLRLRAFAYAASDTVGFILGAYSYGDAKGDQGKFTVTLRRPRNGQWEIFSDMDNFNQPRRQAAPSAPPPP